MNINLIFAIFCIVIAFWIFIKPKVFSEFLKRKTIMLANKRGLKKGFMLNTFAGEKSSIAWVIFIGLMLLLMGIGTIARYLF